MLKSVTSDGITFSNLSLVNKSLVNKVDLIQNDSYTGGNTGAASSDRGDNASGSNLEVATSESLAASLGNLNLNNIVDTEDSGKFTMDIWFDRPVDRLFFWERGMNSKIMVQALDAGGKVLSQILLNSKGSRYAGFDINTTEVGQQQVGTLGVALNGAAAQRFRLIAASNYNGPDFKVMGAAVPEPITMSGTALAMSGVIAARRKQRKL